MAFNTAEQLHLRIKKKRTTPYEVARLLNCYSYYTPKHSSASCTQDT